MQSEKPIVMTNKRAAAERKKPFRLKGEGQFIFWCLFPALLFVAVFTYYPLLRGVVMSFQNYTLFDLLNIQFIGLDNFVNVVTSPDFPRVALNSFFWVVCSLFFQLLFGLTLALLMRRRFRGRGIYQALVFFPWAMSAVIIANIWYGVAFFAIMILAALQSIPEELYEAAAMDRASHGVLLRPTEKLKTILKIFRSMSERCILLHPA
ncbi:sugar ABC transporter permease [Brevibacillus centrosporus]|uniref:carbohydrate ABC transporter permease n=1 Tax=Brevibacillus centrosporus TaxID=54910 RepID=UPI002E1EA00D|nr:sugar ABC transporter permease [Brevibacillus centrosporus]